VPKGYRWTPILRWGDPLFSTRPAFNPAVPDAEAQERQFGYNNDYLDISGDDRRGRHALLCCNHEYTNRPIMFPPTETEAAERECSRPPWAAHGFSVVELVRSGKGRPGATCATATSTGGSPRTRRSSSPVPRPAAIW
jgi:secreted PhoX family phosphatase